MTNQNKTFKVFTKKLANALCKKGFKVVGTAINNEKPWLNVFLFDDTEDLRTAIKELTKQQ